MCYYETHADHSTLTIEKYLKSHQTKLASLSIDFIEKEYDLFQDQSSALLNEISKYESRFGSLIKKHK